MTETAVRPVVWLTGLSGSGKSTLAQALHQHLAQRGQASFILDGDAVRTGLCRDLGFSAAERAENIRRMAEVAKLFAQAGVTPIVAAISPYTQDRRSARALLPAGRFVEVHLDTPLAVCEQRDPKGLYARARRGTAGLHRHRRPLRSPRATRIAPVHAAHTRCRVRGAHR